MTTTDTDFVSIERISQSILLLHGHRVILDRDLPTIQELAEKLTQLERLVDSHDTIIVDIMKPFAS